MAQMVRCEAGLHHYNPEQHSSCPYCRKVNVGIGETKRAEGQEAPKGVTRIVAENIRQPVAAAPATGGAEETRRVAPAGTDSVQQPVVGWLVCTEGPNRGRDYRVKAGKNSIGREAHNVIQITGDNAISRAGQAFIFYDDKAGRFHFKDGENNQNLNYINGETVLNPVELKRGDMLQLGDTVLMFVPLCGDDFKWSDV